MWAKQSKNSEQSGKYCGVELQYGCNGKQCSEAHWSVVLVGTTLITAKLMRPEEWANTLVMPCWLHFPPSRHSPCDVRHFVHALVIYFKVIIDYFLSIILFFINRYTKKEMGKGDIYSDDSYHLENFLELISICVRRAYNFAFNWTNSCLECNQ